MKIAKLLKHRLYTYFEFLRYIYSRLPGLKGKRQPATTDIENNYWGYISSLNDEKRKRCSHLSLRKISKTKFYCQNCGAELRYIREEVSVLAELVTVALSSFFIYYLIKKISSRRSH